MRLLDSVGAADSVSLDEQLIFTWRGGLCPESEKHASCSDIIFEVTIK